MVRWRACLVLAVLLLLPRTGSKADDEEDDDSKPRDNVSSEESEEDDDDDDDDDDEEPEKAEPAALPGRRPLIPPLRPAPARSSVRSRARSQPRGPKSLPLECYVCSYKNATPLKSCLDPVKFRVHSVTCHNLGDKCFTSVTTKGKSIEVIVRGCRAGCLSSTDIKCCEENRCNNQAFAVPLEPAMLVRPPVDNKATKSPPPSVLFFVTILLLLQTVVKAKFRKNLPPSAPLEVQVEPERPALTPVVPAESTATKSSPPSVLFFVTILLLLQTVAKVSFV